MEAERVELETVIACSSKLRSSSGPFGIVHNMEKPPQKLEVVVQFPEIAKEIDTMATVDQVVRTKAVREGVWDDESLDRRNTARMKEVVAQIGWPTISRVGEKSSSNAWLLVQHADQDVEFQSSCLALIKQEPPNEVLPGNTAMLEDRVRVNQGHPQMYGTQFLQIDGKHVPKPIEDEANVNERRRQMGLGTLEEGIAEMYEKYGAPEKE